MKRGIYLLPAFFTLGNLAAGFYSILFSIKGDFTKAAWVIIIAICLDVLDGKIARMTKTTSLFGIEFDSMADLVSCGIAPAILMYMVALKDMKAGVIVAFLYLATGAIRLTRFNIKAQEEPDKEYFDGLPIPAAAGILSSFIIIYGMLDKEITLHTIPFLMNRIPFIFKSIPILIIALSFLMVSSIKYFAFKRVKLTRQQPLKVFLIIIVLILMIWLYPQNMIFIIFFTYVFSGIIGAIWRMYHLRRMKKVKKV